MGVWLSRFLIIRKVTGYLIVINYKFVTHVLMIFESVFYLNQNHGDLYLYKVF